MADTVRLTVVASQGEADVICSLLRAHGIECGERTTKISAHDSGSGYGGWREALVRETDLAAACDLLATRRMQGRAPAAPGPGPYRHSDEDPQSRLGGAATARERRSLVEIDLDVRGEDER